MKRYDYLIVGAGLYGAVFARELTQRGKSCLVIDRRNHVAGNIYTEKMAGINVHKYGAHIFHTSDREVWEYVNQFAEFNNYVNSPLAVYQGRAVQSALQHEHLLERCGGSARRKRPRQMIERQVAKLGITEPQNLEEQALSLVGTDVYTKLIKGYTEKQWGRDCTGAARVHHPSPAAAVSPMTTIISTTAVRAFPCGGYTANGGENAGGHRSAA